MIKILITNRKGGVGKSTSTLNLANEFANNGYKTLVVDLDTQGHIQYGLDIKDDFKYGIHSLLVDRTLNIRSIIQKTKIKNLDFIPADINYNSSLIQKKKSLKNRLKRVKDDYDICVIDTAPMSDTVLEMAILASNYVIVPMKTEYLGLVGTTQFIKIFYNIASRLKTEFIFLGVLPTLYNKSIKEHNEILDELIKVIGKDKVLNPIRKDTKLTTMFKNGIKSLDNEHSRGIEDYKINSNKILSIIKM